MNKDTVTAIAITAASVIAVGGMFFYVSQSQRAPIGKDGCLVGQTVPAGHTIILIDQTDKLDDDQLQYVRALILREYLRLNTADRFSVVGLAAADPSAAAPTKVAASAQPVRTLPSFSRCRIQMGSEADWTVQNPEQVAQTFQKLVGNDLANTVAGLKNVDVALTSPILETLDKLVRSVTFGSPQIHRRLVIVSDMAQYTPGAVTHYPPPGLKFSYSGGAPLAAGDLSGMAVRVHYVVRKDMKAIQNADHRAYWQDYFKTSGASDIQIGWGLSPDSTDDTLGAIRDIASAGGSLGNVFGPDKRDPISAAPAIMDDGSGSETAPGRLSTGSASSRFAVEPYAPPAPVIVTLTDVNIRQAPFTSGQTQVLGKATPNQILDVIGLVKQADGYWYQIRTTDGRSAYVRADMTSAKAPLMPRSSALPGDLGGDLAGAPMAAAPAAAPAPLPRTRPKLLRGSPPQYPKSAAQRNEQGVVGLEMCVSRYGAVSNVFVRKTSGSAVLDEASRVWMLKQAFQPATEGVQAVDVCGYEFSQEWKLN